MLTVRSLRSERYLGSMVTIFAVSATLYFGPSAPA